ncbi:MAG: MATE family efflux transporter [Lachnospiraceae bacterium]|nr:MATE family efflux transporter [Lachnospiraceae bacterium]MBR5739392.1 MATE family efflux transporter [Lachnospiraceae bacterium]
MKETIRIAVPAMIESFFGAVVTLIDSKMVSSLGTAAVASIALTGEPVGLRLAPFTAINVATAALIARRKGEGKPRDAHVVLFTSVMMSVIVGALITFFFLIFSDPLLHFMGSQPDTHDNAVLYFRIISISTLFTVIQNCINAAHRGAGYTKISMQTHLVSTLINVILNYLLIEGHLGFPRLEIFGAALATAIGMAVASVLSVLSLFRKNTYLKWSILIGEKVKATWLTVKQIMKLSYSIFVEILLVRVGMVITSKMTAALGTAAVAANKIAGNFMSIAASLASGLHAATVALVGRSLGEGRPDRIKSYVGACRLFGVLLPMPVLILFAIFVRPFFGLFFSDLTVVDLGATLTVPVILTILISAQQGINMSILRGAGDNLFTAIIGVITSTLVRPLVSYLFAYLLGLNLFGIWIGVAADNLFTLIISGLRVRSGKWKQIRI